MEAITTAEAMTAENRLITLFVALNYGGRAEIVDAARRFEEIPRSSSAGACTRPTCTTPT